MHSAKHDDGWTALIRASTRGHIEVVGLLLAAGSSVDRLAMTAGRLSHAASSIGHNEVVMLLVSQ